MPIIRSIKQVYPGLGSPTAYNSNINAACTAGNTTISIPVGASVGGPVNAGLVRVKTEPAAMGVNAQVRVLTIKGDDGASNVVEIYSGDGQIAGINVNIDSYYEFATDLSLVNVNILMNVINNTTNISVEVAGGP